MEQAQDTQEVQPFKEGFTCLTELFCNKELTVNGQIWELGISPAEEDSEILYKEIDLPLHC